MAPVTDAAAPSTATSEHDRHDRVEEDERDRGRHLGQATPDEEAPGVVGVDQAPDRAGEQQLRDDPGGQQQTHLVGVGAVRLQAQRQGDERHPVAERRHHAPHEGDDQVAASLANVQHLLNSIS